MTATSMTSVAPMRVAMPESELARPRDGVRHLASRVWRMAAFSGRTNGARRRSVSCDRAAGGSARLRLSLCVGEPPELHHGPRESVADAWSILAAIGAVTSKVGLCGAVKPGFRSPFLVARMLDTMSKIAERRMGMKSSADGGRRSSTSPALNGLTMTVVTTGPSNFCARSTDCSSLPPRSGIHHR